MKEYVVFLDRATLIADLRFPEFDHTWVEHPEIPPEETAEALRRASIAITNKVPITRVVIESCHKLKLIAVAATGVNNVDLDACREHGIAVCNIRGYAEHAVPEHVFMLLLALRRNLLAWRTSLRQGAWGQAAQFCLFDHEIHDLAGSTLGLIGYGNVGEGVARLARAFAMEVLIAEHKGATTIRPGHTAFDEVLARADQISLHVPLTDATRDLIGAREFGLMKKNAVLINTARGGVVNEASLLSALKTRRIAGAGFDVLSTEPPREGNPLLDLDLPNFLLTPHVAWSSREAMQGLGDQLIDNIEAFVRGEARNRVV
ncbi:MAG: D-2-hydroxyacid dehydrogenase [Pseudomonadota bacterium]|nr:D-2-hydroxyacid dehydrogenase [Pseudomonadota bacterium]MDP1905649.1 D-2-hydroxyacid dehydrogenase [Pseudomonadota bacterium]MDP2353290.1 D-2-hydroxyacid dehydrogenase [Pseudomonadota bacterium]